MKRILWAELMMVWLIFWLIFWWTGDILEVGDTFVGDLRLSKCGFQGDYEALLSIHGTRQYDSVSVQCSCAFFCTHNRILMIGHWQVSNKEWIAASVATKRHGQLRAFPRRGYFSYATRQLVLVNTPDDLRGEFTMTCRFSEFNDNHAFCAVTKGKTKCGDVIMERDFTRGKQFYGGCRHESLIETWYDIDMIWLIWYLILNHLIWDVCRFEVWGAGVWVWRWTHALHSWFAGVWWKSGLSLWCRWVYKNLQWVLRCFCIRTLLFRITQIV